MFDLTLFPLTITSGREQHDLSGLLAVNAPRKCERMRAQDQLLLFMRLTTSSGGAAAFTNSQQKEILSRLAETYFNSSGSVTAGLRVTAARLNDFLLNRNLKAGQSGQAGADGQTVGSLTLAVAHAASLYVAHSGPTHTFFLNQNQIQHYDDGLGMRALGLSRQAVPRFYQTTLSAGDMLILCPDPPASWARSLVGSPAISFDHLRRRLLSETTGDFQAAVLRYSAGKGQVTYWRPAAAKAETTPDRTEPPVRASEPPARTSEPLFRTSEPPVPIISAADAAINAIGAPVPEEPLQGDVSFSAAPVESAPEPEAAQPPAERAVFLGDRSKKREPTPPPTPRPARRGLLDLFHIPSLRGKTPPPATSATVTGAPAVGGTPAAGTSAATAAVEAPAVVTPPAAEAQPVPGTIRPVTEDARAAAAARRRAASSDTGYVVVPRQPVADGNLPAQATAPADSMPAASNPPAVDGMGRRFVRSTSPEPVVVPQAEKPRRATPAKSSGPSILQTIGLRISTAFASLGAAWNIGKPARARVGQGISNTAAKILPANVLPKRGEPLINLSSSTLLAIAILVPVMVVTVASTVYIRIGLADKFVDHFHQAQQYAKQAAKQKDPALLKQSWTSTYNLVKEAEKYGSSEEATALRKKAEAALDDLQGIVRLDFQPALTNSFGLDVNITRMVATLNQVFLLDATDGRILSMTRVTSGGFEPNPYFTCSPAKAGGAIVGPLIDMAEIPVNNEMGAEIMGIDGGGNLVYCSSGKEGFDSQSLAYPDLGWGQITAITTYGDTLYVLDPPNNAVYRYDGSKGIFAGKPHLYFDNEIPKMKDVTDLAVDQEFLYMLHADGSMTVCSSGGVSFGNTRCTDPAPYGDPRPGSEPSPLVFPGSQLIQLQTTQPPDPSLFALDPANRAIYHLSQRRLNLQRIYLNKTDSDYPYPNKPATAFAITPNRRALIAFGNQLFFAALP